MHIIAFEFLCLSPCLLRVLSCFFLLQVFGCAAKSHWKGPTKKSSIINPDSNPHKTLLSLAVTPSGLVRRLVWPGLLVASFTANLLFAGLYVYYQWGWFIWGSTAAIMTHSQSVRALTLRGRQTASTLTGCCLLLSVSFIRRVSHVLRRIQRWQFFVETSWTWILK